MTPFSVALVASCSLVAHPCVGVFAFIGIFGLSAVLYPPWLAARAGYYAKPHQCADFGTLLMEMLLFLVVDG